MQKKTTTTKSIKTEEIMSDVDELSDSPQQPPAQRQKRDSEDANGSATHHKHRHHHHKHAPVPDQAGSSDESDHTPKKHKHKHRPQPPVDDDIIEELGTSEEEELSRYGVDAIGYHEARSEASSSDSDDSLRDFVVDNDDALEGEIASSSDEDDDDYSDTGTAKTATPNKRDLPHTMAPHVAKALMDDMRGRGLKGAAADMVLTYLSSHPIMKSVAHAAARYAKGVEPLPPSQPAVSQPTTLGQLGFVGNFARLQETAPPPPLHLQMVPTEQVSTLTLPQPIALVVTQPLAALAPGDDALPIDRAEYRLLMQMRLVSEHFRLNCTADEHSAFIQQNPGYNKSLMDLQLLRTKFMASFDRMRSVIVASGAQRRDTPIKSPMANGKFVCFSECSHGADTPDNQSPSAIGHAISPNGGGDSRFSSSSSSGSPNGGGFLAQLFDDAGQCYSISICSIFPLTAGGVPAEYGSVTPATNMEYMGFKISSSVPNMAANATTTTHVEALVNTCIIGLRFNSNRTSTWKTYVVPRGIALFMVLVFNARRVDRQIATYKFAKPIARPASTTDILDVVAKYMTDNEVAVEELWTEWRTSHIALRSLLTSALMR
jgi:hypothetical protein